MLSWIVVIPQLSLYQPTRGHGRNIFVPPSSKMCSSKGTKKGHVSGPVYKGGGGGTPPVKFARKTRANFNPLARITLAQG